jgi:hypothetical protein
MFVREITGIEKKYLKKRLYYNYFIYKTIYLVVFKDAVPQYEIEDYLILYYNSRNIIYIKNKNYYSLIKKRNIYDLYEIKINNLKDIFEKEPENNLFK